jgi:hypothetical protein
MILTGGIRIKRNEILRKLVGLSSSAKLLFWYLLTIVDFAGEAQGKFRGYINDLVALTEIKYDTAYRAIKELEERCLLKFSAGRNQYDKSEIEIIGYGNFLEADKKQIKSKSRADKEHGLEMALRREDASSKNLKNIKNIKNLKDSSKEESPGGIVKGGNLRTSASRNFREAERGEDLPEEVWMKRQLEKTAANWEL